MSSLEKRQESLGEERTHDGLPAGQQDPPASLGDEDTRGDRPSTNSDLNEFEGGWEEAEETLDFETRYEVLETIGEGGMGQVVRALDRRLRREVAVKRLKEGTVHNPKAIQRFLTEARAVAGLNHFNVVQIHDVGRDADGHFIVMELVAGESLAAAIARQGASEPAAAVDIIAQVCNGLSAAHQRGIVHRDIKPANILLTESGIPKLADFGLARWDTGDAGHTSANAVLGTLDFMPPEQRRDARKTDARSDIWSLSATLYQMLTGESPRVIRSDRIPTSLRAVVLKALEDDPAARYPSAEAFRDALQAAQSKTMEQQATTALQEGQCAKCGHVNHSQQEFCQRCGAALQESCPGCARPLPIWAKFCGACGADVQAKLAIRLAQLKREKKRIESLRTANDYGEVERRLKAVLKLKHSALAAYTAWAERTLRQVRSERKQLQADKDRLFGTAQQRFTECQYAGAMHYLQQIPEAVRDEPVQQLMTMTGDSIRELAELGSAIPIALRAKRYDELNKLLDRYLSLKPEDPQANQLLKRLKRRERAQAAVDARPGLKPVVANSEAIPSAPAKPAGPNLGTPLPVPAYLKSSRRVTPTATDGIPLWVYWVGAGVGAVLLLAIVVFFALPGDSPEVASSDPSSVPSGVASPSPSSSNGSPGSAIPSFKPPARVVRTPSGPSETAAAPQPFPTSWNAESPEHAPSRVAELQCLATSPDHRHMVSGHGNREIMWTDLPSTTQRRSVAVVNGRITCICYVDARRILVSSEDRRTQMFDVSTGKSLKTMMMSGITVRAMDAAPDGRLVLFGCDDGSVRLWDLEAGTSCQTMMGHQARVNRVLFYNETLGALSAADDGTVRVWNLQNGSMQHVLQMPAKQVVALAVSDDSQVLAAAADNTIQLWRLPSAQPLRTLNVAQGWVSGLALTPTGRCVLSGGQDGTVIVWESSTGKELHRFRDSGGLIVGLELLAGAVAMTIDDRGTIHGGSLPDHLIENDAMRQRLAQARSADGTGQTALTQGATPQASGLTPPLSPPASAATAPAPTSSTTPPFPDVTASNAMNGGDDQPLIIHEFQPAYGDPGDEVTLTGRGFKDTQRVIFCYGRLEQEARFTVESDTEMTVIVPIGINDLRTGAAIEVLTDQGVTVTIPEVSLGPDLGGISSMVRKSFAIASRGLQTPATSGNLLVMSGGRSGKGVAARIYLQPGAMLAENSVSTTIYYVDVGSLPQNASRPMVSCQLRKVPGVFPSFVRRVFNQPR